MPKVFRMSREAAAQIQGLRAMLHLLFRLFCSDAKRYAELVKEGEVGSTILSVVEQIIRAESNTDSVPKSMPKTSAGRPKKGKPKEVSGITAQSFYPASYSSAHQPATGRPKARFGGLAKEARPPESRWCDFCGNRVPAAMGSFDNESPLWYCFNCWQVRHPLLGACPTRHSCEGLVSRARAENCQQPNRSQR
ncbi:unnamed protein product, partial [Symbiodinium sp. KB8]